MFDFDHEIIMHRDVHFGGSFEEMLSYYEDEEHLGIQQEFEIARIKELAEYEKSSEKNLSSILNDDEIEKVKEGKKAYQELKAIYEIKSQKNPIPLIIADLILTENKEAIEEIKKAVRQGEKIVPELITLLKKDDFFDSLFPGYGYAPYFAILALSQIKDKRTIIPLFETIGKEMVFDEEAIFVALAKQGDEAKNFLLKILKSRPITQDNIHAALALASFADPDIEGVACHEIQDQKTWKNPFFFTYLLSLCQKNKDLLLSLTQDPTLPKSLKKEIEQSLRK